MKFLNSLISDISCTKTVNAEISENKQLISGLAYDSRKVKEGFIFFALPGIHSDGQDFILKAIENGAKVIIHEKELASYKKDITYLQVNDARKAMSKVAASFYDYPSKKMTVIGVTGTEGKSTTVWLIYSLLDLCGKKAGFISTVDYKVADKVEHNTEHQTTPEATTINEKLSIMASNNFEYAVIESSSHGLSEKTARLIDIEFDAGVMTNVRHEHLEFHKTWECYQSDKANLFRALNKSSNKNSYGFVCDDDKSADYFCQATTKKVFRYSVNNSNADYYAKNINSDPRGSDFVLCHSNKEYKARINIPGSFNVENMLGAIAVAENVACIPIEKIIEVLPLVTAVNGRMTVIAEGQDFDVIVDYAHTPSSFETVLPSIKKDVKGKLICLFGSAGERDTQKRPEQGKIASKYSDVVILCDEDPRGEEPMAILEEIAQACTNKKRDTDLFLIPDRASAISKAFSIAKKGDCVVLLGKGHENTIIYEKGTIPWNEINEAKKALKEVLK